MESTPWATEARVSLIEGRAGTGKTEALVARAAELVEQGCDAGSIALFGATYDACRQLTDRLRRRLGDVAPLPHVGTLRDAELALLGLPAVQAATGRRGTVLLEFEEALLLEDLKTTRVAPKRLGAMLRFFYKSWADLEPMEGDWFYNEEEERVHACLEQNLAYRRAYLEAEVARRAWEVLTQGVRSAGTPALAHVLVDDFTLLSRASQSVACALARETLTVAGDPLAGAPAAEEFPYPQGLAELARAHSGSPRVVLETFQGSEAVAGALNQLASDETLGAASPLTCESGEAGSLEVPCFSGPEEEFEGIARRAEALVGAGAAPESVAVAGTKPVWARNLQAALAGLGLPVSPYARLALRGDFRSCAACAEARAVTLLKLVADPEDPVAVRSWCGFGDHLANSGLFAALGAQGGRLSLDSDIAPLDENASPLLRQEAERARAALAEARELTAALKPLRGVALLEEACRATGAKVEALMEPLRQLIPEALGEAADAARLAEALAWAASHPHFVGDGIRVGVIDDFAGLAFPAMMIAGLVGGLLPQRSYFDPAQVERDKRPALLARAQRRLYAAMGAARQNLVLSYFDEAPLPTAEKLSLKIDRVRLKEGRRMCALSPSEAIRTITGVYYHD